MAESTPRVRLVHKRSSTFHDFPYCGAQRKCLHSWIVNVTPPGFDHCVHQCLYCYARDAIFSRPSGGTLEIYDNLPELVARDLDRMTLCPPISISNTTDPCQPVPELRREVARLVRLLVVRGVSFLIVTKGDATFLLDVEGFAADERKFVATTIEGPPEVLRLLSPRAPTFDERLDNVRRLAAAGVRTAIRLDPLLPHVAQAVYGSEWQSEVEWAIERFALTGCGHVTCSTGRLSRKPSPGSGHVVPPSGAFAVPPFSRIGRSSLPQAGSAPATQPNHREEGTPEGSTLTPPEGGTTYQGIQSSFERIRALIADLDPPSAEEFARDYVFDRSGTSTGYLWRRPARLDFHHRLRELCETLGMTYSTCQENSAEETDSAGLPNCEGYPLPFSRKLPDGRFEPIEGCTARCHETCRGNQSPPCGRPELITPAPLKIGSLR